MEHLKKSWRKTPRTARRVLVSIVGTIVILAGIAMLVLPGPGWVTIFLGLAILATEFERAEKLRATVMHRFKKTIDKARSSRKR